MAIVSTKGTKVFLTKAGAAGTVVTATAITKAKPAVVTVASVTGITAGDIIVAVSTGFPELDGKTFVVQNVTTGGANTFELAGSDTTGSSGTFATGTFTQYKPADKVEICLSSLTIDASSVSDISVATFCNPTGTVPGNPQLGGITLEGFIDITKDGYKEIQIAGAEVPSIARYLEVVLPSNGYLVCKLNISSVSWTVPLEGSASYSATATQVEAIKHAF